MNRKIGTRDSGLTTILAVALAGIIQVIVTPGPFTIWNVMVGLILIFVLKTFREYPSMGDYERLAFSSVWGLTIVITLGFVIQESLFLIGRKVLPGLIEHVRLANGNPDPARYKVRDRYIDMSCFVIWLLLSGLHARQALRRLAIRSLRWSKHMMASSKARRPRK